MPSCHDNSQMETREFVNNFPNYPSSKPKQGGENERNYDANIPMAISPRPSSVVYCLDDALTERIKKQVGKFVQYLEHPKKYADFLKTKEKIEKAESDFSVYTGQAGIAMLYMKLGKLDAAHDRIKVCLKGLKKRKFSFLTGDPGPLAIAAVLAHRMGKKGEMDKNIKGLMNLSTYVRDLETELPDELLYGRAGYLLALLFVSKHTEDDYGDDLIPSKLIRKVIDVILASGKALSSSREKQSRCPLLYEWHGKRYYGAAHGLAGIYVMLLQCREQLTEQELRDLVKPSVDYLLKKMLSSGNYPSSDSSETADKLVHWCHGAPGVIHLMLMANSVWNETKYLDAALRAGELIWKRGLLRKGHSLCHGTAGNGYAFIHLYQKTTDQVWLYRAAQFATWCMEMNQHNCRIADRPLSLFEGLAGTIYFLHDMLDPKNAKFPAFIL